MPNVSLPHDARAGPTKPAVRAVLRSKLDLGPDDHFAEVGSCTGAVTIEAARRAGRVTALERKPDRLDVTRRNLAANGVDVEAVTVDDTAAGDTTAAEAATGDTPGADTSAADIAAVDGDAATVVLRAAEAPAGLPDDVDVLFLGGSRNYEAVLDHAVEIGVDRVVMNVSRLEVAGAATAAFRDRGLLEDVLQFQVSHGYELAGATSFDSQNPVYMIVGGTASAQAGDATETAATDGGVER